MLDHKKRYLQIAFNYDLDQALQILPFIPKSDRIIIEAGTPFIKREGIKGIKALRRHWPETIVADLKISDGAIGEISLIEQAHANGGTVLGSSPTETLNIFIEQCKEKGLYSMIDMLGVSDPLKALMKLKAKPDVVIIHMGRDEEITRGKIIEYKHVNKIKSKFDVLISAAGGMDVKKARSAIFNGANIVVVNVVSPGDLWIGMSSAGDIAQISQEFLKTIG